MDLGCEELNSANKVSAPELTCKNEALAKGTREGRGLLSQTWEGRYVAQPHANEVKPLDVGRVVSILSSEPCMIPLRTATGFRGLFLAESTEASGELSSITWWDSAEEGQAYLASPACREVVDCIRKYLVRPLERQYYEVHIEASPPGRAKRKNS